MDIKRLFLAIIVSFVFMIVWTMFFGQEKADTHQRNDALNVSEYIEDDLTQNNINNQDFPQSISILKNGYCIVFRRRANL